VIAYLDACPFVGNELNWHDIPEKSYALTKHHFAAGSDMDLAP
jgi:hypothetical protein